MAVRVQVLVGCSVALVLLLLPTCQGQFNLCFKDPNGGQSPPTAFDFTGVDTFGMKLFQLLAGSSGSGNSNLMVSPYSIWSALSLALMGTQGNTRMQLEKALGLPNNKLGAYRTKFALDFVLNMAGSGVGGGPDILRTDRGYFDSSVNLKQCVSNVIHNLDVLDFNDAAKTAAKINNDVSIGTGGHIKDFLSPSALVNSVFVLINAIYFRGTWASQFKVRDTNKQVFYNHQGIQVATVDMMSQTKMFKIVESPALGATMLELPYVNSNISMLVLLPDLKNPSVDGVLQSLNPYTLRQALSASKKLNVEVFLPKFDLKTEVESELVTALNTLGVTDMFNPSRADFSDFSDNTALAADTVIHQAIVKVDEIGTIAAAVTAVIGTRIAPPSKKFKFIANRPFIFLIYEKRVQVTLFAGVVKDPTK